MKRYLFETERAMFGDGQETTAMYAYNLMTSLRTLGRYAEIIRILRPLVPNVADALGLDIFVASLDAKTAFELLLHRVIEEVMRRIE